MASTKKNTTPAAAPSNNVDLSNIAKFLPEGFSLDDFETVGGLRPICPPELNEGSPIAGFVVALLDMPPRSDGSDWQALLVHLVSPAKARAGDETVDVEPGKDVLIPVGGNIKNNGDLQAAAVDPTTVTMAIFTVLGTQDVGKLSPMWVYDVKLALKKRAKREGAFALYHKPTQQIPQYTGEVQDKNGKPLASLVG